jgi:hypothetical protein
VLDCKLGRQGGETGGNANYDDKVCWLCKLQDIEEHNDEIETVASNKLELYRSLH